MKKSKIFIPILIVLIALTVILASGTELLVNLQWFKDVGYIEMYFIKIVAVLKFMAPIFLITFIAIYLYYKNIMRSFPEVKSFKEEKVKNHRFEKIILFFINFVISAFFSYNIASSNWYRILQFNNSVDFNVKDPLFNMDISFYIFKLPLVQAIYDSLLFLVVIFAIITIAIYFISTSRDKILKGFKRNKILTLSENYVTKFFGKQMALFAALVMIMISVGYILRAYYLVYSERGNVYGAGYIDVNVTLLFYRIITVMALISSVVVFVSLIKKKVRPIIISVAAIMALIISEPIVANLVQQFKVNPNEYDLEEKYINYNIDFTRKAFNLDDIEEVNFSFDNKLTQKDIEENEDIIDNLKINSFEPVLDFYNQVQVIKNYYTFNDVDTDRYYINGKYNQVFISPREINSDAIDIWQNKHLRYTHGYGLAMTKVNSVTAEGQPDFVIKDIPPENTTGIEIDNPRIYFGESTNDYAIVNTDLMEFDYPQGEKSEEYQYEGETGIKMNFFNKILFSLYEGNTKILLSDAINKDSKILLNRNIMDRVQTIAPFLQYERDPYLVINEGELVWVIDAYTISDKYPYSQPYDGINYIRNSIKVTVDAYDGEVNFYIIDENDPIAQSYAKIYTGLFKSSAEIPEGIKSHYRYPAALFDVQCEVLTKYHVTDSFKFFTEEDVWQVSTLSDNEGQEEKVNESPYVMTRLPNEENTEMMLFEYFNIKNKQNMSSIFGARMDGDNFGKLIMYKFPPQKTIYSPTLFMNKINQDTNISKEISLWNSKGSTVEYGDTLIIPINESLLYAQTLYLRSQANNSIPEMKRVILFDGESLVIEENIDKALLSLFNYTSGNNENNNGSGEITTPNTEVEINISKAKELYQKAIDAQKNGDWAAYGEYIKELGNILNNIN